MYGSTRNNEHNVDIMESEAQMLQEHLAQTGGSKGEYVPLKDNAEQISFIAAKNYGSLGPPSIASRTSVSEVDPSVFTDHGKGLIDLVLAYQPLELNDDQNIYREVFERKLRQHGLYLEHADLAESQDGKTCFVKIHATWDVLARMAEINRVRVPLQQSDIDNPDERRKQTVEYKATSALCCGKHPCELEEPYNIPIEPPVFTMEFQRSKFRQYLAQDPNTFFTQTQRIMIVWDIVSMRTVVTAAEIQQLRKSLIPGHMPGDAVSLNFLLDSGVYVAVYPLHDGDILLNTSDESKKPTGTWPMRPFLYETWAKFGRWRKYQPLDQVRKYFGEKVAMYFTWLGFYTRLLWPLSIVGAFVVLYGALINLPGDPVVADMCTNMKDTIICRKCGSVVCPFTTIGDSCLYSMFTSVFNNTATVFYALFTAVWGICFLEFWKRTEATAAAKWDVYDFSDDVEQPRPQYVAAAKQKRRHPVTLEWEPYIPPRSRFQNFVTSVASVTFLVCLALAVIIGVILYKIVALVYYFNLQSPAIDIVGSDMFTTITASAINAIAIMILEQVYGKIAWSLTEREYPRTDSAFETSYTYKMYIFQFVNYYATLFYLSFAQPLMAGEPTTDTILTDRCPPAGCVFSVTTQLATVLIVKQVISNVTELGVPKLKNWWSRRGNVAATEENLYVRHEKDFDLSELPPLGLFGEYFEMVMQFGFVTMFVAAFPLAPILALLNNIVEVRVDGYKFIVESRRAIPERASNIGSWYSILEFVARLSVLTNALLIAITTDIIERSVYQYLYSADGTLNGYLEWSLSHFDPHDWPDADEDPALYTDPNQGVIYDCRYIGFYSNGTGPSPYSVNGRWWHVWLAKLAFILAFEHVVFFTQGLIQWLIPDVPEHVNLHVQRNRYLEKYTVYKQEQKRVEDLKQRVAANPSIAKPAVPPKPLLSDMPNNPPAPQAASTPKKGGIFRKNKAKSKEQLIKEEPELSNVSLNSVNQ